MTERMQPIAVNTYKKSGDWSATVRSPGNSGMFVCMTITARQNVCLWPEAAARQVWAIISATDLLQPFNF